VNNFLVIFIGTIVSVLLTITTFPLGNYAPDWIFLFIIYWLIAIPTLYSYPLIWFIGILADVTLGSTLGMNALSFLLLSYLIKKNYKSLRYFTIIQQSLIILIIITLKITILILIDDVIEMRLYTSNSYWGGVISAIVWPIIFYGLRHVRRKYNII
tara:strand:- start:327 stop:794 length:468 start_codon:yes stop_codon:yes gene_type:complete